MKSAIFEAKRDYSCENIVSLHIGKVRHFIKIYKKFKIFLSIVNWFEVDTYFNFFYDSSAN